MGEIVLVLFICMFLTLTMPVQLCRFYALKEVPLDERSKHRTKDAVMSEAKYALSVAAVENREMYLTVRNKFGYCAVFLLVVYYCAATTSCLNLWFLTQKTSRVQFLLSPISVISHIRLKLLSCSRLYT